MHICGAKFQEHCFNSFRDSLLRILPVFTVVANQMTSSLNQFAWWRDVSISGMKKDISGRGVPFFCVSEGLSNKQKKISCHIHFNKVNEEHGREWKNYVGPR